LRTWPSRVAATVTVVDCIVGYENADFHATSRSRDEKLRPHLNYLLHNFHRFPNGPNQYFSAILYVTMQLSARNYGGRCLLG
jgi:hypothetical protein